MTPRELAGWVPAERHEHYDADDNLTGYTIIVREPRINDADVAALLGLAQYEAEVCQCGFHPLVADDPDNVFASETRECPVCGGADQRSRMLHDEDEAWSKANPKAAARMKRPSDGRIPFMRLLSPDEAADVRRTRGASRAST